MKAGRTITARKIESLVWCSMPNGSLAGIIKMETSKDGTNWEKAYYLGSVPQPNMGANGEYLDAREIVENGQKISIKNIQEMLQTMVQ